MLAQQKTSRRFSRRWADRPDIIIRETRYAGQAKELAQQAVHLDCHTVVVGSGDDTINEVVTIDDEENYDLYQSYR